METKLWVMTHQPTYRLNPGSPLYLARIMENGCLSVLMRPSMQGDSAW